MTIIAISHTFEFLAAASTATCCSVRVPRRPTRWLSPLPRHSTLPIRSSRNSRDSFPPLPRESCSLNPNVQMTQRPIHGDRSFEFRGLQIVHIRNKMLPRFVAVNLHNIYYNNYITTKAAGTSSNSSTSIVLNVRTNGLHEY